MHITLTGAVVNVVLDPILIFGFKLGLEGAAIASVLARIALAGVGLWGVTRAHDLLERPDIANLASDMRLIGRNAVPAMATNIATPVANAYVTAAMAEFGDSRRRRVGDPWPRHAGRVRRDLRAVGRGRAHSRPELRGRAARSRSWHVHESLKINAVFTVAAWMFLMLMAARLPAWFGADAKAAASDRAAVPLAVAAVRVPRRPFCRQCRFQHPGAAALRHSF